MKKQIIILTLALIAILISVSTVSGANLTVGTGGIYANISSAYDAAANNGDIILIADGQYSGAGNTNITIAKNITIQGQSQTGTIINGAGTNRIFKIQPGVNVILQNLTLTNGNATDGGAIYNYQSNLTVNNCTFTRNNADYSGAIGSYNGNLIVNGCTFTGNKATVHIGAVYSSGNSTISNSIFNGNSAKAGGAIAYEYGTMTVTGCNFYNNIATGDGYGFGAAIWNSGNLTVKYSRFVNNTNGTDPQDIQLFSYSESSPSVLNATLNWWGSNDGPTATRLLGINGYGNTPFNLPSSIYDPWLVMNIEPADSSTIYTGRTSKITVNVYKDSAGSDHSADAAQFFSGPEVTFTTNLGNVGSKSITVPWTLGLAFAILRGDEGPGIATVTAADVETLSTTVNILQAPVNPSDPVTPSENEVNAANNTVGMQETGIPFAGLILAILAVLGGVLTPKRK